MAVLESCCDKTLWTMVYTSALEAGNPDPEQEADDFFSNVLTPRLPELVDKKITFFFLDGTTEIIPSGGVAINVSSDRVGTATLINGTEVRINVEKMRMENI